jgi:hypothetical protein
MIYKKIFLAILLLTTFCATGQQVKRGPRNVVNLSAIPDSAFYAGKIFIKIKAGFEDKLKTITAKRADGNFYSDIDELDIATRQLHVTGLKKSFEKVLETSLKNAAHKAWGFDRWFSIELPKTTNIKAAIAKLRALSNIIEEAEPSYKRVLFDNSDPVQLWVPSDSAFSSQWHFNHTAQQGPTTPAGIDADIDLPEAWELEKGKSNVIVAVIDGGVDTSHPDLRPNLWVGTGGEHFGYNWNNYSPVIQTNAHGTHTTGTIAAVNNNTIGVSGIAGGDGTASSGVRIMSMQIFNGSGSEYAGDDAVANAFIYSADRGAAIAQNSWGGGDASIILMDAIDYFIMNGGGTVLNGGIVFFSAGNDDSEAETFPANYPPVLGVAATNYNDQKGSYSNFGSWVDISAPGGEPGIGKGVLSTVPASTGALYGWKYGTSMACPHVSGIAALCISKSPGLLSNEQLRNIILQSTDDIYPLNPDYAGKLGTGRANAFKAVQDAMLATGTLVDSVKQFKETQDCENITLTWIKNASNNNVIIAESDTLLFGTPSGTLNVGDVLPGGGTVIYKGSGVSLSRQISLNAKKYYRIWSYSGSNYSFYKTTSAIYSISITPGTLEDANGCGINISWGDALSCMTDSVLLVANNQMSFGIPTGILTAGTHLPGGGKVIYKGRGTNYHYTTDLDSNIYIQKWNFNASHQYTNPNEESYESVSKPNAIASITALAISNSVINISWSSNAAGSCFEGNAYMLAYSTTDTFGNPLTGAYSVGSDIIGGGTVLYVGTDTNFQHTGLSDNAPYCYRVWKINNASEYSAGKQTCSRTLCSNSLITLPYHYGFNGPDLSLPDICKWEVVNNSGYTDALKIVASGNNPQVDPVEGMAMLRFNSFLIPQGNPVTLLSRSIKKGAGKSMDLRFRWYQDSSGYFDDEYKTEGVTVRWSANQTTWQDLEFYPRVPVQGLTGWSYKQITLPDAALSKDTIYLSFVFNSAYGNNCYLDDLTLKISSYKTSNGTNTTAICESTDSTSMWTNYYDKNGDRLLSIRKNNTQIGKAGQDGFSILVGGTNEAASISSSSNYVSNPGGWLTMKRYYSFKPLYEPTQNINLRFYYFTNDFNAIASAASIAFAPAKISHTDLYAWKINNVNSNYDPNPATGHIGVPLAINYNTNGYHQYVNAALADTTTWQYKNLGNSLHSMEYLVKHSGGGGLGIGSATGRGALQVLTYTFTGNGNWSTTANWLNSVKPPALLPSNGRIVVDPQGTGECILNIQQTIPAGAEIIINPGKKFKINGGLQIKK